MSPYSEQNSPREQAVEFLHERLVHWIQGVAVSGLIRVRAGGSFSD